MLARSTRSGLVETTHEGVVAAVDSDGGVIAHSGDIDRPFFLRSAAKPFQALTVLEEGLDLSDIDLALAVASHHGFPAHIAIVEQMLESVGLGPDSLQCPLAWPLGSTARQALVRAGHDQPARIWHNCSGKHTSWLMAARVKGWPTETYLHPEHPLQQKIIEVVSDLGDFPAEPVGVDGCGAPVLLTTARAMARLFSQLGRGARMEKVRTAMHRYPALVSCNGNADAEIAVALDCVAKGGAAGALGVGLSDGVGIAVRAWDGSSSAAGVGALATLAQLGRLEGGVLAHLADLMSPAVLGGGRPVGALLGAVELESR